MIVIRYALVCVAMDRSLENPLVVVMVAMVDVLMQGNCENRNPGHGPQQRAHNRKDNEISSHDPEVSHERRTVTSSCETSPPFDRVRP